MVKIAFTGLWVVNMRLALIEDLLSEPLPAGSKREVRWAIMWRRRFQTISDLNSGK